MLFVYLALLLVHVYVQYTTPRFSLLGFLFMDITQESLEVENRTKYSFNDYSV